MLPLNHDKKRVPDSPSSGAGGIGEFLQNVPEEAWFQKNRATRTSMARLQHPMKQHVHLEQFA